MLCDFFFDSIDTGIGNDNYPGPNEAYALFADSQDRIWFGTYLPIFVCLAYDGIAAYVDFGVDQYVDGPPATGDRGEIYSWVERVPGEVWAGAYSAKNPVIRMCGSSRQGFTPAAPNDVNRGWRPRTAATNGTVTYWPIGPTSSDGLTEFGGILEVDASGSATKHSDLVNQDIWLIAYDSVNDKILCVGGGEGIPGAKAGADFYQIDPTTWEVDFSQGLGGSRGLSMHQLDDDRWLVITHLTSTTEARLQVVNTATQTREWLEVFDGESGKPSVPIYGRIRNSIVSLDSKLWCAGTNYIYEIDVDNRTFIERCNISRTKDSLGGHRPTNLVGSQKHGLVMGVGNRIWAWDPRS